MSDATPQAAPATDATPQAAPATPPPTSWYSGLDTETVGWLDNKGITKLDHGEATAQLVKGYRSAEKYIGVPKEQLLRMPDFDKADKVELDAFFTKLGRPNEPKGYDIKSDNADFASFAENTFHEAGLTAKQAKLIEAKWNEHVQGAMTARSETEQQAVAQQAEALKKEWGAAHDQNIQLAKVTSGKLGLSEAQVDAMEKALGFDGVMKLILQIGQGEDSFVGGSTPSGPLTPGQAQARITALKGDKDWSLKYLNGNADATAEMDRLMKMAYPG